MANITYNWSEVEWWSDATNDPNVRVYWRVIAWCEESNAENYSNVHFKVQKSVTNYPGAHANYPSSKSIKITGTGAENDTHSATATWSFGSCSTSEWVDASGNYSTDFYWSKVKHNNDGTLTVRAHITGDRVVSSAKIDTYVTLTFPTIPRGSTITAFNNFTIESGFSFTYKDALANKALTLTCTLGNTTLLTKSYTSAVGTHTDTISFTNDQLSTIYTGIGSTAKTGTFKLTLTTADISGSNSASATGTLASATNKPTVGTPTMAENNSSLTLLGVADTEIIRYLSRKKISVTATAIHGASISSVSVKNGDNGTAVNMPVESGNTYSAVVTPIVAKFIVSVTDSRGFVTTAEISGTLKEYTYPTVSKIEFNRDLAIVSTGFIRPTGSYWNGTAGNTTNVVQWYYTLNSGTASSMLSTTTTGDSWQGSTTLADGTLLRDSAYTCEVTVRDIFGQTASAKVSIGIAELSLWLGKYTVRSRYFIGEFFKGVFPVGSIYMSVTNVNPSVYFGGTWEQVAQGRTLIGVGSIEANTVTTHGSVTASEFNATANERGGTYSHRHFMSGQDADGPLAAVGAVDSNVNSIGYVSYPPSAWGPSSTRQYALEATMMDKNTDHSFNHHTPVFGYTRGSTLVEPYLAVYIWQRTA